MQLVTKPTLKSEIIPIVLMVFSLSASFYFYLHFPDRVPTHWNIAGEVDGWSTRSFGAFFFPALTLAIYLLLLVIPNLDPKKERYEQFLKPYHIFKNFLVLFLVVVYFLVGANGIGYKIDIALVMPLGVGLLFILLGNYMGKIKMNWFMGIRTPWTLSSEEVWNKTHRLGGKAFILGGVLMALTAIGPPVWKIIVFILVMTVILFGTLIYSYVLYAREQKNKNSSAQ